MSNYVLSTLSFLLIILWPNMIKMAKSTRPEYFYWDFLLSLFATSLVFAFVIGFSPMYEFPTFIQNITHQFRFTLQAFMGGCILGLAYFLFVVSVFLVGVSYSIVAAFSIAMSTAAVIVIITDPAGFPHTVLVALIFFLICVLFLNASCRKSIDKSYRSKKAITYTAICGIVLGFFFPLVAKSMAISTNARLSPHVALFFFACGTLVSFFFISLLMKYKPLIPPPFTFKGYFQKPLKQHIYGIAGGFLWGSATMCRLLADVFAIYNYTFVLSHIYPLITAACGIFIWKEYKGHPKAYKYLLLGYVFFILGGSFLRFHEWTIP